MSRLLDNLSIFGRVLRRAGIPAGAGRLAELVEALTYVDLGARDDVYQVCRALLVRSHDQMALFDLAFAVFWREHARDDVRRAAGTASAAAREAIVAAQDVLAPEQDDGAGGPDGTSGSDAADAGLEDEAAGPDTHLKTWSVDAALSGKDFAAFTSEELATARAALAQLVWRPGERRTRRWRSGRGARVDLRRAIAASVRSGGDVVTLPRRTRRSRPRPLVLLCDVSGSMERYSRMLLHFAHAVTRRHQRVETFLFSTDLTRVTRELRAAGPDEALAAVSRSATGWSGGTRIGAVVKEFHQRWSRRVLHGGPVALLISDGWDRGDPQELAKQIARLQRSCHRLIWLNPLIGTVDYAPLTRGLQAALPFVDDFLPVRTLTNLAQLAIHLNALT
jgi:uncharacterized protein with von Willebrand factor type A (vWA) domain